MPAGSILHAVCNNRGTGAQQRETFQPHLQNLSGFQSTSLKDFVRGDHKTCSSDSLLLPTRTRQGSLLPRIITNSTRCLSCSMEREGYPCWHHLHKEHDQLPSWPQQAAKNSLWPHVERSQAPVPAPSTGVGMRLPAAPALDMQAR